MPQVPRPVPLILLFVGFLSSLNLSASHTKQSVTKLKNTEELMLDDLRLLKDESEFEHLFETGTSTFLPESNITIGKRVEYEGLPLATPRVNYADASSRIWSLFWVGKTFYRDNSGEVKLDNMLLPTQKELLGLDIDFVTADVSFGTSIEDGKSVVVIDYANTELPLFRPVRDEIRLVSAKNNLYIGRANVYIHPKSNYFKYLRSVKTISLVNKLINNGYNCKADNGGKYPEGDYCFGMWFALQKK